MLKHVLILTSGVVFSLNAGLLDSIVNVVTGNSSISSAVADGVTKSVLGTNAPVNAMSAKPGSPTASGSEGLLNTYKQAEDGLNNSIDAINLALADKTKLNEWKEKEKTINAMMDGSDKEDAKKELNNEQLTFAAELVQSNEVQAKAKKLSAKEKKKVGQAIGNLYLVMLKDKQVLEMGQSSISTMTSNPLTAISYATELSTLKDIVTTVPVKLATLTKMTPSLSDIAKNAKIPVVQPTSASQILK